MQKLTWPQVNRWRLAQQHLLTRVEAADLLPVVKRLVGVQAQLMSAAELALWVRVQGLTPSDIQRALWTERQLVKTWAMRGTLHLLTATDFGHLVSAWAATTVKRPPSYYTYHKVTSAELTAIIETVPLVLSATPLTREELAAAVVERTGNPNLSEVLLSGWGALLKPSARRGDICFGPSDGQHVTFVRPDQWLGSWEAQEPTGALQAVARTFLTTYGPATLEEFARWWGIDEAQARKLFKGMADELTAVEVEGWQAHCLTSLVTALTTAEPVHTVRLLPYFDPYTIAIARHSDFLLSPAQKNKVYRAQGWISPVILVDGQLTGVWEHMIKRERTEVVVTLFASVTPAVRTAITVEAEQLGQFLGHPANVRFEG